MSILNELEDGLLSDSPVWMEFLYRYDPKKKQIFAFYEGDEDSSFYRQFILKISKGKYEIEEIVAGCKNNVMKLQRTIDWKKYNCNQIAFFVDRDLSYWIGQTCECGENVFVTEEYSVENYVCNSKMFRIWLQRFEGFSRASKKEVDNMVEFYEKLNPVFEETMLPIMAKAVVAKRHNSNIALKDYRPSFEFFKDDDKIKFTITNQLAVDEKWLLSEKYNEEIQQQIKKFKECICNYSLRGKWKILFMLQLGEHMRLNHELYAPSLCRDGKLSPTCSVSPYQGFVVLAPNWEDETPTSLLNFLKSTYGQYISV